MELELCMAYYAKVDYPRLLRISDDRPKMWDTWEEWNRSFEANRKQLESTGAKVKKVQINLDELLVYCKQNHLRNDSKARSEFASQLGMKQ